MMDISCCHVGDMPSDMALHLFFHSFYFSLSSPLRTLMSTLFFFFSFFRVDRMYIEGVDQTKKIDSF